jgi:hypothetical protein
VTLVATVWTAEQLQLIASSPELEIASLGAGGQPRRFLPIWVVCVADQVYVRSWYRRTSGWFGHVAAAGTARIRVPGVELDVVVTDLGGDDAVLRTEVDQAYRDKYGTPGDEMVAGMITDAAAATTLRLAPAEPVRSSWRRSQA